MYKIEDVYEYISKNLDDSIDKILNKDIELIENPIFIVGCGHSGTTLLNKLLGHHSNIFSIPDESWIFGHKLEKSETMKIFKLWSYLAKKK